MSRPPLRRVPMFTRCRACTQPFRLQVDFTDEPPCADAACAWCGLRQLVCA